MQIAAAISASHDSVNKTLNSEEAIIQFISTSLLDIVKLLSFQEIGWLVIDDPFISKMFAELIGGIDYNYHSPSGRSEMSLCAVDIGWVNGKITIPVNFDFFLSQDIAEDHYKRKIDIAKILITALMEKLEFKGIVVDGLYCSTDMINFLNNQDIEFEMRMSANRVIENEHSRSLMASWRGIPLYFTAELTTDKNG